MAGESARVAEVIQQEGDRVILSVPMVGFPSGFRLRPGEKVVLVNDEGGPTVRPLVRAIAVDALEEEGDALKASGQQFAIQASTVHNTQPGRGGSGRPVVFVVDQGSAEGPEQVLAIRPGRL